MPSRLFCSVACGVVFIATMTHGAEYESVTIRVGAEADSVELKVAELLQQRIAEPSGLPTRVERTAENVPQNSLLILLGIPAHHPELQKQLEADQISALTQRNPGPEGFLVKMLADNDVLLAAGVDQRGVLYAAGEILRQLDIKEKSLEIPDTLDVRTAPAFAIRGTQYGQSGVAKRLAKVRDWTPAETQRVILDYALAGANTFSTGPGPMFDFIKSFGLMTQGGFGANTGPGPPEWNAKESIGRIGYLCLSVPAARAAQLKRCEDQFRSSPTYDFVKFHGGDGGGCECDLCDPYGLKFIKLVEKMAAIIHKYHPTTKIYFTNQKFDNADDNAIFKYLQEQPRDWLWGWGYGPGSDATSWQPGHRQTHRMDLFRYPGFGPYGLYPREILRQLPPRHQLVYYNEITHWRYAQHAYIQMYPRADRDGELPPRTSGHEIYERRPDQGLTMVYDRLTFYAWPRFYHRVFNDLMRYGVGDITHSSGHHDHFNQWMWQRLLWAPRTSVEDVVDEYCQTWFGREAAPLMAKAIFQLEENLEEDPSTPLIEKKGIDRNYLLVSQAGAAMPKIHLQNNWLWRQFMQKAALDKYTQLAVRQQTELQAKIEKNIAQALTEGDVATAIDHSLASLDALDESAEMAQLREEAGRLGEESNALFGVRNEGYFNLKHDFLGLGWLRRQLEHAKQADGDNQVELLQMIVDYENPGPDGYYDNLGTSNRAPHVVKGYPYDHGQPYVSMMLSEGNRPSQRSMHFTQDESEGVTLKYHDLDPNARYRVRFTFVRPWYQSRYAERMNQKSQTILADDLVLAEDQPLPERMSEFFTFDIPQTATRDGELTIQLRKAKDVANGPRVEREQWRNSGGWGTLVSEVWLMKQDD
ncbi:hypothetical protein Pan258_31400 [Symmachiella dynata]|uniref:hypothetical protein n=1 Tax=Symmachiella dynata TaxID=2527995 RepID=UPI0011883491|nr:hypothetical protein [Symmachiella dynata]QDT49093.1 hypothetical protein Pan258_31400 [Symmachiella dynata]